MHLDQQQEINCHLRVFFYYFFSPCVVSLSSSSSSYIVYKNSQEEAIHKFYFIKYYHTHTHTHIWGCSHIPLTTSNSKSTYIAFKFIHTCETQRIFEFLRIACVYNNSPQLHPSSSPLLFSNTFHTKYDALL